MHEVRVTRFLAQNVTQRKAHQRILRLFRMEDRPLLGNPRVLGRGLPRFLKKFPGARCVPLPSQ